MTNRKKSKRLKICLPFKKTFCFICVIWGRYGFQSHDLSAAKLNAYGLKISAVTLIFDCLTNRKPRTKTDGHYSSKRRGQDCHKHLEWRALQ